MSEWICRKCRFFIERKKYEGKMDWWCGVLRKELNSYYMDIIVECGGYRKK